jgi:hypothetical protein
MHEVTLLLKFTTGTTCSDAELAKETIKRMLLKKLSQDDFALERGAGVAHGIFEVEVIQTEAIKLR